jgi:site-specific DNA recombinase
MKDKTERKPAIYVRVSTEKQSYEQQLEPCINFLKYKGFNDFQIYKEIESTGKERPVFREMLKNTRDGKHNAICVWKIDRAWRNTREFVMDFDNLINHGVDIFSVTEGLDPTTIMGKGMMTMIVVFAEIEKANISKNTKDRLQALKNMGKKLGRPKGSTDKEKRNTKNYYDNINATKKGGVKNHGKS